MTKEQVYLLVMVSRIVLEELTSWGDKDAADLLRDAIKAVEAQATP